jgi:hypothetical protein
MDWKFFFSIGVPTVVVVAGWYFAHRLTAWRELASRKREARLKALEAAYMRLATSSNRVLTNESMDKLETFVSEIQLYGTPRQITLMGEMVEAFKRGGDVSYDALLADLRDAIRSQLELEPVVGHVWWFRFTRPSPPSQNQAVPESHPDA